MTKISIITPNYNYGHFISRLLNSIAQQNYANWEHIIIDDGSTDNSVEIIKTFALKDNRIKLYTQENRGQTRSINAALTKVQGEIIGWINSDDYYTENVFDSIANIFSNKKIDAVIGDIEVIDANDQVIKRINYPKFNYLSGVFNGFGKIISSNAIFWRKEITEEIGVFDEDFNYSMDAEYWSRILLKRKVLK